jgi:RHS repeat-associated protein
MPAPCRRPIRNEPFGTSTVTGQTNTNSYQYTGRENDGTGLDYYRARYYSPSRQRFIREDPIGFASGDPNLYGYVFNSPVNLTDPSGEIALLIVAAVACGAGAVGGIVVVLSGRKPTLGSLAAGAGIGCAGGLAVLGSWVVAAPYLAAGGTAGATLWPSPEAGRRVINGIEYTYHALVRMAPVGLIQRGTEIASRGVPPSVVEPAVKFGARTPGSEPGTIVHSFENVTVVTANAGRVVLTVIKTGR